jgi:N-dimethylarginine dimethylaminohydrolase
MISTTNEWDTLKSIIVGSALGANKPYGCHFEKTGPYPSLVTKQAEYDLNKFVEVLEQEGVKVHRPIQNNFVPNGMYNYCPRDRLLVIGNTVIDCNMQYSCRIEEINYMPEATKYGVITVPMNEGIFFDAANVCRLNNTLLYLISPSGNAEGAKWLQNQFPEYTVETTETYSGIHIDSTFVPVRNGLVVVNKDRVSSKTLPKCFKDWDVIWLGKDDLKQKSFVGEAFASNYILLNFLMVNPKLAVIDDCPRLEEELTKHGVVCITVPFKHSRTLGGGHHCVTLDLIREPNE